MSTLSMGSNCYINCRAKLFLCSTTNQFKKGTINL